MSRGPRRPKNIANYSPVGEACAHLRKLADDIEACRQGKESDMLLSWTINLHWWTDRWLPKAKRPPAPAVTEAP